MDKDINRIKVVLDEKKRTNGNVSKDCEAAGRRIELVNSKFGDTI